MRIWDIKPERLCRNHLLGEHRELHAIWAILTKGKKGYSNHPETVRWKGKLRALFRRHEMLVQEMHRRAYQHNSSLNKRLSKGHDRQDRYVTEPHKQISILRSKKCGCRV
jgi:hypothetical protein